MSAQIGLASALVTAFGAVLVAALVVSWAQASARRTERWERATADLSALLDVELNRAIERLRRAMMLEVSLSYAASDADPDNGTAQALAGSIIDRHAAEEAVDELVARLARLELVVRLRLGGADGSRSTSLCSSLLRALTALEAVAWRIDLSGVRSIREPEAKISTAAEEAKRARQALADWVRPIALRMKPPRPLRRLLARRVGSWFGWLRRLRDRLYRWTMKRLDEPADR